MQEKKMSNHALGSVNFIKRVSFIVCVSLVLSHGVGERTVTSRNSELEQVLRGLNKPGVKTIKSDYGYIIDCVELYRQPAFDHPLLKNHTIQLKPSWHPKTTESKVSSTANWEMRESCPYGTIPIRRVQKSDLLRTPSLKSFGKKYPKENIHFNNKNLSDEPNPHQFALVIVKGNLLGSWAYINTWNPLVVASGDYTTSQLWIKNTTHELDSIEAGWIVNPSMFGDNYTRFFTYWTNDGGNNNGCYNHLCPGFIQVSSTYALGGVVEPVSTYGGAQYEFRILVYQDPETGNWWLQFNTTPIGYWPSSLFKDLSYSANMISYGGATYNSLAGAPYSELQMGSGHFPSEGYGKSSYISNFLIVHHNKTATYPPLSMVETVTTNPNCYDVVKEGTFAFLELLYHGGPGCNEDIANGISAGWAMIFECQFELVDNDSLTWFEPNPNLTNPIKLEVDLGALGSGFGSVKEGITLG